jgi:hypothetical protein
MTVQPMPLAGLLAASRVFALREAVVATLQPLFPDVTVKPHLARLDMADVETGESFSVPSLNIGVIRLHPAEQRLNGTRDVPVELAGYIVTGDQVVDGRGAMRDEVALALCDGFLSVLEDAEVARWGLDDIGSVIDAEARPLFTARSNDKGLAYFVVTWKQTIYTLGELDVPAFGQDAGGRPPWGEP